MGVPGPTLPGHWKGHWNALSGTQGLCQRPRPASAPPPGLCLQGRSEGRPRWTCRAAQRCLRGANAESTHIPKTKRGRPTWGPLQGIFVGGDLCHTEKRSQDTAPEKGGSRTPASPGRRCREPVAEGTPERTPGARPRSEGSPAPSPRPCTLCVRVLS